MPRAQKRCTFLHPLGELSLSRHSSPEEQSLHHSHHEFHSASGLGESTSLGATRRGHLCTRFPGWQGAEAPAEQAPCKVLMIRRVLNTRHRATGWPSRSRVIRQLGKHTYPPRALVRTPWGFQQLPNANPVQQVFKPSRAFYHASLNSCSLCSLPIVKATSTSVGVCYSNTPFPGSRICVSFLGLP